MEALAGFIREIGLSSNLSQLGIDDEAVLKEAADRCVVSNDGYKKGAMRRSLRSLGNAYKCCARQV